MTSGRDPGNPRDEALGFVMVLCLIAVALYIVITIL